MKIIDYFHSDDQPHWLAAIAENEWRAAKYLARLLASGGFHQEVGKGTVYLLTEGETLISFLTMTERDCIDAPEYAPWIGFVHTAPGYRGHRHIGKLSSLRRHSFFPLDQIIGHAIDHDVVFHVLSS